MPIRPDLLPLYRTPEYKEARALLVARAGNKCEQCGKPNGVLVECVSWVSAFKIHVMYWRNDWRNAGAWVNRYGIVENAGAIIEASEIAPRFIKVVCTFAHLDHNPANNAEDNKAFLCQWCHLNYDGPHHKYSRSVRKDRGRPLLSV